MNLFWKKRGPLDGLFRDATGYLWLFSTAINLLLLASPLYMTQVYSHVLPGHGLATLLYLTLIIIGALAVYGVVESVRAIIAQKLSARYELTAARELLARGLATERTTEVAEALKATGTVRQMLSSKIFLSLYDLPFAPLFLIILFLAHPLLGVTTLVGGVVLIVLAILNNRALGDSGERSNAYQSQASRYASAALRQGEDVRGLGMAPQMVGRWEEQAIAASGAADEAGTANAFYYGFTRFVRQTLQVLVLGLGAYLVLIGQLSAGLIFAASLLSGRALQPVEQMIGGWRQLTQGYAAHQSVNDAVEKLTAGKASNEVALPAPTGMLSLEGAGYDIAERAGPRSLLADINLTIEPGEIVAVMGPSGAGKSTLARLMAGIVAPTAGHVRLDGFDLAQWPLTQRGSATGYLGQDSELLDGTVAQNIARFTPGAGDAEVVLAAQRANAHEFIARLPDGYMTRLGSGGIRLSGGQAQRIGLARALFGNPVLLVLDEPNAHLDSDGERALIDALAAERTRGRAIVVVSQRSSILAVADRVALIRDGRLENCRPARDVLPMRRKTGADDTRFAAKVANFQRLHNAAPAPSTGA